MPGSTQPPNPADDPSPHELIAATDAARADYWDLTAIGAAQAVVADAVSADLAATTTAAKRRLAAARGRLTRARAGGDPARILAAENAVTAADDAYRQVLDAAIDDSRAIFTAHSEHLDALLAADARVEAAWRTELDALAGRTPPVDPDAE